MTSDLLFLLYAFIAGIISGGVSGEFEQLVFFHDDIPVPENTPLDENRALQDSYPDNTVNTTLLMTYNDIAYMWDPDIREVFYSSDAYNMAYDGFVYGFQFWASFDSAIRISIWRWSEFPSPYFAEETVEMDKVMMNGSYTLVGMTEESTTTYGLHFVYFKEGLRVTPNDFLGITYGDKNPLAYDVDSSCTNVFVNTLQTCSRFQCNSENPDWVSDTWYGYQQYFDFNWNTSYQFQNMDSDCKMYSLQALLMPDTIHSNCKMVQLTNDNHKYELTSHLEFGIHPYANNEDRCWLVRAADENSLIHADLIEFDVELDETCDYDVFYVESADGVSTPQCGRQGYTQNIYISSVPLIVLRFQTDSDVTASGFRFDVHSIDRELYNDYITGNIAQWPWEELTNSQPQSSTASTTSPTDDPDDPDLALKIAIGIGASILGLLVIIGLLTCCYVCCCREDNQKKKVQPQPVVQNNKAPAYNTSAPYPQQRYNNQLPKQPGVYSIPQLQGPSNRTLPPLSTGMLPYPRAPGSNYPPQVPSPYPKQKYGQPPDEAARETPLQPNSLPPPPPQTPEHPSNLTPTQPKHSLSTIAFALVQPKPLKSKAEPFGGAAAVKSQPKTEAEMMTLAKARLNWRMAVIPGPATYIEPHQWKQGYQGAPPVPPGYKGFGMFAEEDVSYDID